MGLVPTLKNCRTAGFAVAGFVVCCDFERLVHPVSKVVCSTKKRAAMERRDDVVALIEQFSH